MTRWHPMLAVSALLLVSGCRDVPTEPAEEAEPPKEVTSTAKVEVPASPSIQAGSTVCDAFRTELVALQADVVDLQAAAVLEESKATPGVAALQADVAERPDMTELEKSKATLRVVALEPDIAERPEKAEREKSKAMLERIINFTCD